MSYFWDAEGANIEATDSKFGGTALTRSAARGKLEAVESLLEEGGVGILDLIGCMQLWFYAF